jgi:hypothetical protein
VQDRALEYLDMMDRAEAEERRVDMVKALLVQRTIDVEAIESQFPEYFDNDPFEEAKTPDGEYDIDSIDDSKIDWGVATPEEDDEISAWIDQHDEIMIVQSPEGEWQ